MLLHGPGRSRSATDQTITPVKRCPYSGGRTIASLGHRNDVDVPQGCNAVERAIIAWEPSRLTGVMDASQSAAPAALTGILHAGSTRETRESRETEGQGWAPTTGVGARALTGYCA